MAIPLLDIYTFSGETAAHVYKNILFIKAKKLKATQLIIHQQKNESINCGTLTLEDIIIPQ